MSEGASSSVELGETPPDALGKPSFLYYGWTMVVVAAVAMVATLPGRTHGLGMITERLLKDPSFSQAQTRKADPESGAQNVEAKVKEDSRGLTRTSYGVINLWATLLGALFCLGCGRAIDRFGVRNVLALVLCLLGLVTWSMTHLEGIVTFFILLTLTRGFGQSALSVVSLSIVGKWFVRRLSWAMALYSVLMALGFVAAFQIGGKFANQDWRVFWGGLGGIVFLLGPLAWLVTRNSPEEIGLPIDGLAPAAGASAEESGRGSFTLGQALRTPAFWVFGITTSLFGLVTSGISLFNESILVERGFPKERYYQTAALGIAIGLVGNFTAGWLASFWSISRLTAVAMAALAAALAWLTFIRNDVDLMIYVVVYGLAGSVITVVFFTVWAKFYGRSHLGRIQGAAQMLTVFASAVGPLMFGAGKELYGSYAPMLWTLAGFTAMLAVVSWYTPLPALAPHSEETR